MASRDGRGHPESRSPGAAGGILHDPGASSGRKNPAARGKEWRDVQGGHVDPTMPYVCFLPSGRSIKLFFYDGPVSRDVAFGGLLANGEAFAARLMGAFSDDRAWPQLVHVATDGETYGHHHPMGDMALAYCLELVEKNHPAAITIYSEFLEKHPPTHEVQIVEKSSWSCIHGIERWRENCDAAAACIRGGARVGGCLCGRP